jgi:hypothetical protein
MQQIKLIILTFCLTIILGACAAVQTNSSTTTPPSMAATSTEATESTEDVATPIVSNVQAHKPWAGWMIINLEGAEPQIVRLDPTGYSDSEGYADLSGSLENGIKLPAKKVGSRYIFTVDGDGIFKTVFVESGQVYVTAQIKSCELTIVPYRLRGEGAGYIYVPQSQGVAGPFYKATLDRIIAISGQCEGLVEKKH